MLSTKTINMMVEVAREIEKDDVAEMCEHEMRVKLHALQGMHKVAVELLEKYHNVVEEISVFMEVDDAIEDSIDQAIEDSMNEEGDCK
jgi:queuine/archaeosine tRNA-ribosyltransferase